MAVRDAAREIGVLRLVVADRNRAHRLADRFEEDALRLRVVLRATHAEALDVERALERVRRVRGELEKAMGVGA